jgi:hypothetical protein
LTEEPPAERPFTAILAFGDVTAFRDPGFDQEGIPMGQGVKWASLFKALGYPE